MILENNKTIHLIGKNISYVMYIDKYNNLLHYHFGERIPDYDYSSYTPEANNPFRIYLDDEEGSSKHHMYEYQSYGYRDLRSPAYSVLNKDGNTILDLKYKSHVIYKGKYRIDGMPSLFGGNESVESIEITLTDAVTGMDVILLYSVYDEYDIITRSVKFIAHKECILKMAQSACLEIPTGDYDVVCFTGAWLREREVKRTSIMSGTTLEISNGEGGSGHHVNPFVIVCDHNASEVYGDVYAFSLVYSGDHASFVSKDVIGVTRVTQGINPLDFEWELKAGEEFSTPECIMAFSSTGMEHITHTLHDVFRNNLCKSKWSQKDRPVLINNWEGTYFDFDEKKLLEIARDAAGVGCELFVLDDGWFGHRNDDKSSLGDWYVNKEKLPAGLNSLARKVNAEGLMFGLWFEPEMISRDSDLYREHPDWAINVSGRKNVMGRNQLILDLSKNEVCDYIIDRVNKILSDVDISYVKWDMNRDMTDRPCMGFNHKYILGLYKIFEGICGANPDVLFEGCASGGGRFDPGILAYMPQIWASDNSEAASRTRIQYGSSFAYPWSSISAHVTAIPNHQNGREPGLKYRGDIAATGAFGYELDITKLSDKEKVEISNQISAYKNIRTLLRTGDFYRLDNPYETNRCAWEIVSKDKREVFLMASRSFVVTGLTEPRIRLRGLNADYEYELAGTQQKYSGLFLMNYGLYVNYGESDFSSTSVQLKCVK